jgi:hypothetical protein
MITLDESWIYMFSGHDLMWTALGEIVVDRERHTVRSPLAHPFRRSPSHPVTRPVPSFDAFVAFVFCLLAQFS